MRDIVTVNMNHLWNFEQFLLTRSFDKFEELVMATQNYMGYSFESP